MEQFLDFVIRALVEYPDDVIITKSEEGRKITFRVKLRQSDVGKIIGRNGQVIDAARHILNAAAARQDQRVMLDIVE